MKNVISVMIFVLGMFHIASPAWIAASIMDFSLTTCLICFNWLVISVMYGLKEARLKSFDNEIRVDRLLLLLMAASFLLELVWAFKNEITVYNENLLLQLKHFFEATAFAISSVVIYFLKQVR